MAFLKRILEANGIPAKHIRLNIIPVKMTYNENFDAITDLDVESPVSMDFNDHQYILKRYDIIRKK